MNEFPDIIKIPLRDVIDSIMDWLLLKFDPFSIL